MLVLGVGIFGVAYGSVPSPRKWGNLALVKKVFPSRALPIFKNHKSLHYNQKSADGSRKCMQIDIKLYQIKEIGHLNVGKGGNKMKHKNQKDSDIRTIKIVK